MIMTLLVAVPFFVAYFLFGRQMIFLFMTSESGKALETGVEFLHIISPFYFAICIKLMADGVLRGGGAMKAFMVATFSDLILRVILAFLFSGIWQERGIWLSWPLGWVVATLMSLAFYKKGVWKQMLKS